jgi:4-amino-4-deoxy-L-arabinose transferase-like glycosyltransferase
MPLKNINIVELLSESAKRQSTIFLLFLIAFTIRIILWIIVSANKVIPTFDEATYYNSALAYSGIYNSILHFTIPDHSILAKAYGGGIWPPMQSMILGIFFLIFGKSPAIARFAIVILSSVTTILVFYISKEITNHKTAIAASLMYCITPSFIFYSHTLWSETSYIFFILLMLFFAIKIVKISNEQNKNKLLLYSFLFGSFSACACLCRGTALLIYIILMSWAVWNISVRVKKIAASSVMIFTFFMFILPWLLIIYYIENQFILIAKNANINFVLSSRKDISFYEAKRLIEENALKNKMSENSVAKKIWLEQYLKNKPKEIFLSLVKRFTALFNGESFIFRHLNSLIYPPLSAITYYIISAIVNILYFVNIFFTFIGFLISFKRIKHWLILWLLIGASIGPYVLTLAVSRYSVPTLVIAAPMTGCGILLFHHCVKTLFYDFYFKRKTLFLSSVKFFILIFLFIIYALPIYKHMFTNENNLISAYYKKELLYPNQSRDILVINGNDKVELHPSNSDYNIVRKDVYRTPKKASVFTIMGKRGTQKELCFYFNKAKHVEYCVEKNLWKKWTKIPNTNSQFFWLGSVLSPGAINLVFN